jgi:leucyl-tRNA synthetase
MFASPPEQSLEWSDSGVDGAYRFLKRVWTYVHQNLSLLIEANETILSGNGAVDWQKTEARLKKSRHVVHHILAQANNDYERSQFNTVVSGCMKLFNELSAYNIETDEDRLFIHCSISILLRLLAPITPHICHHLWQEAGFEKAIIDAPWPRVDKSALKTDEVDYVVQVNGKMRAQFTTHVDITEEELVALAIEHAASFINDNPIKKTIIVTHRQLINLVIG